MKASTILAAVIMGVSSVFAASTPTGTAKGVQSPSAIPQKNVETSHGCYKSKGKLVQNNTVLDWFSSGACNKLCIAAGKPVAGLRVSECYCGDEYPPKADVVPDSNCNYPCQGYDWEACGGIDGTFYSIFNVGIQVVVNDTQPAQSTAIAAPSTSNPTGATGTSQPAQSQQPSGGSNVAGIAAGVVVSVVVVIAGIGGVFYFLRRRRNREIEEEHRRNAAVNAFINGSKPPSSSGGLSMTDSRLDPVLAHRRLSDGSIADNQDYSRKILRVTNA